MIKEKLYKNALISERLTKLSSKEKQTIILRLLKNKTERQLEKETGIAQSTIHDWKTLRQNNTGVGIHLSLSFIYAKLKHLTPEAITDWGRIEQIKERCEELLRKKC